MQHLNADPDIRWCPGKSCSTYFRLSEKKSTLADVFECNECKTRICVLCGRAEHRKKWLFFKKTCEDDVNEDYENWSKGKAVQNCPQCKARVEKDDGCNHMTCK